MKYSHGKALHWYTWLWYWPMQKWANGNIMKWQKHNLATLFTGKFLRDLFWHCYKYFVSQCLWRYLQQPAWIRNAYIKVHIHIKILPIPTEEFWYTATKDCLLIHDLFLHVWSYNVLHSTIHCYCNPILHKDNDKSHTHTHIGKNKYLNAPHAFRYTSELSWLSNITRGGIPPSDLVFCLFGSSM